MTLTFLRNYYNINGYGKWEDDKYHLIRSVSTKTFCEENGVNETELSEKLTKWQGIFIRGKK